MHKLCLLLRGFLYCLHVLGLFVLAFVMAGCGPGEDLPGTRPSTCGADDIPLPGGGCQHVGLPLDMPCPPGETPINGGTLNGGSCQPAGVPPDACGQGFEHDGNGGCNPILPPDPCPPGQMAIPGETQCREVAPCGTGDYGLIPVDADTEFVNGGYTGNDSDGTQARPWKTIQNGIDYAKSGAIVAVAAGSYAENLQIYHRPVRLWGRCPALVDVVGSGIYATIEILSKPTSHSEVHQLSIRGSGPPAIVADGVSDVRIDRVWIHDTGGRGIGVQGTTGPASVTLSASLIEATSDLGVFVSGSSATIEATVVRATQPFINDGTRGRGISVQPGPDTQERSTLMLRTSLLEQNHDVGLHVSGSDATIEATVVRVTQPRSDGTGGFGINVQLDPDTQKRSTLTLRTSLLGQNHDVGLLVSGSDATIEATVVRATQPLSDGISGRGIHVQSDHDTQERSTLMLRTSLLEQNHDTGLFVSGSDATVEATVVRATQPLSDGTFGRGIEVQPDPDTPAHSTLMLRTSLLEQNHEAGLAVFGSDATIEATVVRATQPLSDGTFGRGISIQPSPDTPARSTLMLRTSLLEQNHDVGLFVKASDVTLEATVVYATQARGDGTFGDGIALKAYVDSSILVVSPATATITSSRIESNARAGISNFSSQVTLISSTAQCNRFDIDGEQSVQGHPFTFEGSTGNLCGCGDKPDPYCAVVSAGLTPPPPISPAGEPSP